MNNVGEPGQVNRRKVQWMSFRRNSLIYDGLTNNFLWFVDWPRHNSVKIRTIKESCMIMSLGQLLERHASYLKDVVMRVCSIASLNRSRLCKTSPWFQTPFNSKIAHIKFCDSCSILNHFEFDILLNENKLQQHPKHDMIMPVTNKYGALFFD